MTRFSPAFIAALALAASVAPVSAQAPLVKYTPEGTRQLIFVNNPERIELGYTDLIPGSVNYGFTYNDLADSMLGAKSLLDMTIPPGTYCNAFEHVYNLNRVATPAAAQNNARYGIVVFNNGTTTVTLTRTGRGFVTGINGGQPFVDALNNPTNVITTVAPGRFAFLLQSEVDFASRPITPGSFFSGTVDFSVAGGSVRIVNIVYQNINTVTPFLEATAKPTNAPSSVFTNAATYSGYVTRRYSQATSPAPESRVYKGLMTYPRINANGESLGGSVTSGSTVATNLAFTISDTTAANAELPVTYPRYLADAVTGIFEPSAEAFAANYWITHNTPLRDNATNRAVSNDMFDTWTPGFGTIHALVPTFTPNSPFGQANIANWCVFYRDSVTITNAGTRSRTVQLTLNNVTGGTNGSPIAYRIPGGTTWAQTVVRGSAATELVYGTVTVPAGESRTVEGVFTLGCPGVGTLRHAVKVTN